MNKRMQLLKLMLSGVLLLTAQEKHGAKTAKICAGADRAREASKNNGKKRRGHGNQKR